MAVCAACLPMVHALGIMHTCLICLSVEAYLLAGTSLTLSSSVHKLYVCTYILTVLWKIRTFRMNSNIFCSTKWAKNAVEKKLGHACKLRKKVKIIGPEGFKTLRNDWFCFGIVFTNERVSTEHLFKSQTFWLFSYYIF